MKHYASVAAPVEVSLLTGARRSPHPAETEYSADTLPDMLFDLNLPAVRCAKLRFEDITHLSQYLGFGLFLENVEMLVENAYRHLRSQPAVRVGRKNEACLWFMQQIEFAERVCPRSQVQIAVNQRRLQRPGILNLEVAANVRLIIVAVALDDHTVKFAHRQSRIRAAGLRRHIRLCRWGIAWYQRRDLF